MRQLLSTAFVACLVGALAGATVSAVAQSPAEPPLSTTALRADTVDGLSAVKATARKQARARKLVATDANGFLPANIVKAKWGLIGGKPAFVADGVVGWDEVQGIPGGLADGVDDAGVTGVKVMYRESSVDVPPGEPRQVSVKCPPGSIAVAGGFRQGGNSIRVTQSNVYSTIALDTWYVSGFNTGMQTLGLVAYVTCLEFTPAGSFTVAKKGLRARGRGGE